MRARIVRERRASPTREAGRRERGPIGAPRCVRRPETSRLIRSEFLSVPMLWRTNSESCRIAQHGPPSGQARSGDPEQGTSRRTALQPRTSQPASRPGLLRAGIPRLPTDLRPASHAQRNADTRAGVEAVVEVAVTGGRSSREAGHAGESVACWPVPQAVREASASLACGVRISLQSPHGCGCVHRHPATALWIQASALRGTC